MANMANVLGLIFANMHETSVADLTKQRTLASVPFGGRYRMIDFPLSNMVNSDIDNVGIITKDNYLSLMDHLGSGDEWDLSRKTGGMHLLPPYGNSNALYRGRLEALAQVKPFIESANAEYVLLSDTDVVANIDYRPVIDFHEKNGADITVVYGRGTFTTEQTMTKTVLSVNSDNVVYDVLIRPEISGEHNVSLNMFVVSKDFLLNVIRDAESRNLYSFEVDVLQKKLHEIKVKELPELDDEFAKDMGEYETVDELKKGIEEDMLKRKQDSAQHAFEDAVIEALCENVEGEIPECMYENKAKENTDSFAQRVAQQGIDLDTYLMYMGMDRAAFDSQMKERAVADVKIELAVEKIIELENIKASDEAVAEEYQKMADMYKLEVEKIKELVPEATVAAELAKQDAIKLVIDSAKAKKPAAKRAAKNKDTASEEKPEAEEKAEKKPAAKKTTKKKEQPAE